MNEKQIQTKRQTKTGFRKLHARVKSGRKKQRVSAAASADMLDSDVPNASIGRALTVILALHVVAIAVIYVGIKWNKGGFDESPLNTQKQASNKAVVVDQSRVNATMPVAYVVAGDTYESFAARHNVNVNELRLVNNNAELVPGMVANLPAEKVTVTKPAVVAELPVSDRPPLPASNNVVKVSVPKAVVVQEAPKAVVVQEAPRAIVVNEGAATYKVQSGDSVWRISNKFKVSQDALMQLNGISDPRQLRQGMTLKIPAQ